MSNVLVAPEMLVAAANAVGIGVAISTADAEAANTSPTRQPFDLVNASTQTLLDRPLIATGNNGAPGTGENGGLTPRTRPSASRKSSRSLTEDSTLRTDDADYLLTAANLLDQRTNPALDVTGDGRRARQLVQAGGQYRNTLAAQVLDITAFDEGRLPEIDDADMAAAIADAHAHRNIIE
ncbi:PE family protein [Mycobacterium simiae]|uniref:PE family protein n=1 Tax=Mycobacterium simiae TaxID=1784 RepID=A0A5B1BTE1_MYCSI|nr:PE family protein [Mycobacterium simiae]KAA1252128.1 PE family protein [Mycobacterium simiae]